MDDLAIIIVSANDARWLPACLSSIFAHAGDLSLDVVVAENDSTDGTRELVESEFPEARVVTCRNRGFSHGNNQGWLTCKARYALFLNPDTEVLAGTFADFVSSMDERPTVGLVGVKQIGADGTLQPTIRRFPSVTRALGEALGSERWPVRPAWAGERELDQDRYQEELEIDWTSGSFMLAHREALLSAGLLDERSSMYTEEPDLCPADTQCRLEDCASSGDDDPPPRRKGGQEPADGGTERLREASLCEEALLRPAQGDVRGSGRARLRGPCSSPCPQRVRPLAARCFAPRPQDDGRAGSTAVRGSASHRSRCGARGAGDSRREALTQAAPLV